MAQQIVHQLPNPQYLRYLAATVRRGTQTRVRLPIAEIALLVAAIGDALDQLDLSPGGGQQLAGLLEELAAQAAIQAPERAISEPNRRH